MDNLERLAAKLDVLPVDPQARMGYDLCAGGLRWSDEMPAFEDFVEEGGIPTLVGLGEFRALLYYRSSRILEEPCERFQALWQKATQLCPHWPGFLPCRQDAALAAELKARREAANRSCDELDARNQQQQRAAVRTSA